MRFVPKLPSMQVLDSVGVVSATVDVVTVGVESVVVTGGWQSLHSTTSLPSASMYSLQVPVWHFVSHSAKEASRPSMHVLDPVEDAGAVAVEVPLMAVGMTDDEDSILVDGIGELVSEMAVVVAIVLFPPAVCIDAISAAIESRSAVSIEYSSCTSVGKA